MSDLISRSALLDKLNDGNIQTTFNLPIEEVLGEDVDIDDFVMLLQGAIHIYREMVIKVISDQPTAYDVDAVVEELEKTSCLIQSEEGTGWLNFTDDAIAIVRKGGVNENNN